MLNMLLYALISIVPDDDYVNRVSDGDDMHPPHSPTPPVLVSDKSGLLICQDTYDAFLEQGGVPAPV